MSLILRVPMLLLVNPSFPAKSVKDLVALAKANPGKYNYGSAGLGSTMYLVGELFKSSSGIDLAEVAYKGGGPALADVVSGQIPITWLSIAGALSFVKAGRVRALSQRELAVARRCDGVAMFSIGWMASAVAHDPGGLLALDIAVDARHPGADLVHELPLTQGQNVIGPFADTGCSGFNPG